MNDKMNDEMKTKIEDLVSKEVKTDIISKVRVLFEQHERNLDKETEKTK